MKRDIRREGDMRGHLQGDAEDDSTATGRAAANKDKQAKKDPKKKEELKKIQYWWTEPDTKHDKELSVKDKLLKDDYQVQQAYNYLRALVMTQKPQGETVTK